MELSRLQHIASKEGVSRAVDFARRTLAIYRTSVLQSRKRGFIKPHHASLPEYRGTFIKSYCSFKKYVRENDVRVTTS